VKNQHHAEVHVYLRNSGGAKFVYTISAVTIGALTVKAREHLGQIAAGGYRHNSGMGEMEWFPPHWIDKVKIVGDITTGYPDTCGGT